MWTLNYEVVLGQHNLTQSYTGISITIQEEILHLEYNSENVDNDFTLVLLSERYNNKL